jgi:signal transduction histidine kinase
MSQFNLAFSLMSVIPLLICCYLITVRFFSIQALEGLNGVYFLMAVVVAVTGLLLGRQVIREIIRRLVSSNEQLERINDQQASFVSNVAHEFRAPLAIVKGALDNLLDNLHGAMTDDQREPVTMAQREINRLKRLVSDLLDLSRIEAGKLPMAKREVVLQDVLRSVAQLYRGTLTERGLGLAVDMPEQPATVSGDGDRLQQVFMNLLTNAAKFTKTGSVRMRLGRDGGEFEVEISDTGCGIAAEDLERIFDKFERVGTGAEEGSGLGLPIARDIVQLHEGRIWAESTPGAGSRFIVRLPAINGGLHAP